MHRRPESLLHVLLHFFIGALGHQHPPVALAQAQAGHVFLVHAHHPFAASFGKHHVGLDQARLLAIVEPPWPRVESADELHPRVCFLHSDLRHSRQVLHIPLHQQMKVPVHNQRRNLHAAPPLVQPRISLGAHGAMRILCILDFLAGVDLGKLALLGRDLNHQAFAQVPRSHTGRVEMLHQVDAAPHQVQRCLLLQLEFGKPAESQRKFFNAHRKVSVSVQVADHEFRSLFKLRIERERSQLPRQVI